LSGVAGTHLDQPGPTGFAKIKSKEEKKMYEAKKQQFSVAPGQWLVFFQNLVHEVLSIKQPEDSLRIYFGFRITRIAQPLIASNISASFFIDQGVPLIPSAQNPPMFSMMHSSFLLHKMTVPWSLDTFHPICLETKVPKATTKAAKTKKRKQPSPPTEESDEGSDEGSDEETETDDEDKKPQQPPQPYTVVHRHMRSLKSYGFKLYPPYKVEEMRVLTPQLLFGDEEDEPLITPDRFLLQYKEAAAKGGQQKKKPRSHY
jgi:hypothetical protein